MSRKKCCNNEEEIKEQKCMTILEKIRFKYKEIKSKIKEKYNSLSILDRYVLKQLFKKNIYLQQKIILFFHLHLM